MSQEVKIRQYREGDEHNMIKLLDIVFNDWPNFDLKCSKVEHWYWKIFDNPLKRNMITVAEHNGKIIGVAESVYLRYKIGSRMYLGRAGYDNAIHPDFQGKGIYSKMGKFRESLPEWNDREFSVGATENPILMSRNIRRGNITFPKKINRYVRIYNIRKEVDNYSLRTLVKMIGFYTLKTVNKISNLFNTPHFNDEIKISTINEFDETIVPFIDKMYDKHDFIYERSLDYLNWRYCDLRGGDYKIFLAKLHKQCVGYLVCRINFKQKDKPQGFIVDFLVDQDQVDAGYLLLEEGLRIFDDNNVNMVTAWVTQGHWFVQVFSLFGFLNKKSEVGIFLGRQDIGVDKEIVLNAPSNRLHIQMGDTDWI